MYGGGKWVVDGGWWGLWVCWVGLVSGDCGFALEQSLVLTQNELMRHSKKQRSSVLQRKITGLRERDEI